MPITGSGQEREAEKIPRNWSPKPRLQRVEELCTLEEDGDGELQPAEETNPTSHCETMRSDGFTHRGLTCRQIRVAVATEQAWWTDHRGRLCHIHTLSGTPGKSEYLSPVHPCFQPPYTHFCAQSWRQVGRLAPKGWF